MSEAAAGGVLSGNDPTWFENKTGCNEVWRRGDGGGGGGKGCRGLPAHRTWPHPMLITRHRLPHTRASINPRGPGVIIKLLPTAALSVHPS